MSMMSTATDQTLDVQITITESAPCTKQIALTVPALEDEGKGALLGIIVEKLDVALMGKKVGDTITVSAVGSESHEREELRGKTISIAYSIQEAERITPRAGKSPRSSSRRSTSFFLRNSPRRR